MKYTVAITLVALFVGIPVAASAQQVAAQSFAHPLALSWVMLLIF
jgi:hypothetical protein